MPRIDLDVARLTTRQLVANPDLSLCVPCAGCRMTTEVDPWRFGARLADIPINRLRLRCRRCGVYATRAQVCWRVVGQSQPLADIALAPIMDEGHRATQEAAMKRVEARNAKAPASRS